MSKRVTWSSILAVIILVVALVSVLGCGTEPSATTAATGSDTDDGTTMAPEPLKVGVVANYGWPIGLDFTKCIQIMVDMDNEKYGGLPVGDKLYDVQFIMYDGKGTQADTVAAINRLIFEDEVKFIISDNFLVDPWLPITEENEITVVTSTQTPVILNPDFHYSFNGGSPGCLGPTIVGWYINAHPETKTAVLSCPDNQNGRDSYNNTANSFLAFGVEPTAIYYPESATDLSSVGLKIASSGADVFNPVGGGPASDGQIIKAAVDAGFAGGYFSASPFSAALLQNFVPLDQLEGFVNCAWVTEFDPAATEYGEEFKAAYVAETGEWNYPEVASCSTWSCLRAAFMAAGSIEQDDVNETLSTGLEYEGLMGKAKMIARPDMGNDRTIDAVFEFYIKTISNSEPVLLEHVSLEDSIAYNQTVFDYVAAQQ